MKNNMTDEFLLEEIKNRLLEKNNKIAKLSLELEEAREKLFDSEHLKTNFLSIIRNELKNPVSAISGLSKLVVQKDFDSVGEIKNVLSTIRLEAIKFALQLDNVLTASSFEGGENNSFLSGFDLCELVYEVKRSFEDEIKSRGRHVETEFIDEIKIYADREKLKLVFKNFLDNALKFSEKNVKLTVSRRNEHALISFYNDGYEIEEKNHHKIFERFAPLDSGLSRKYSGVGLGLCVCGAIIENHGGKIDFSSGKGNGTLFEIELPIAGKNQEEAADIESGEGFIIL
ncbi:MAG: HAMP domain-containing histidine kinase [Desulfobacteraceae bacterium]|nr:HAMP domain-containing histidine kinase [Desulfobacteraceae bacterium]MCB9494294.1 HAMP domain-containing histidine kinase [Desulfobacteraceae bacterium]